MNTAELAIRLTADADDAVRSMGDVGDAAERMASDVDDATRKADAASSRLDGVADSAGAMASSSSQAAGGLGDLGGALGLLPGPLGALGSGMEAVAPAIMGVTGASDLLELAMNSTIVTSTRARAAAIAQAVAEKGRAAATLVTAGAQRVLNVAMRANPIGLAVAAITLLVAGLVLAYKRSETFRRIVQTVFKAVRSYVEAYVTILQRVVRFFTTDLPNGARAAGAVIGAVWDTVKDKTGAAWDWVRDKVAAVIGSVKDRIDSIRDKVATAGQAVRDKLGAAFDWVMDKVQPIIDAVQWIIDKLGSIKFPDLPDLHLGNPFNRTVLGGRTEAAAVPVPVGDTYSITVMGALDPDAVARQIDQLLSRRARRTGGGR